MDRGIRTCIRCFVADEVQPPMATPDGGLVFTCSADHGGTGPAVWTVLAPPAGTTHRGGAGGGETLNEGVTADLLEPLLSCLLPGDPWVEYGVIESRLRSVAPETFAAHVEDAGHSMFGPRSNSASGRVAMALSSLRARGKVHGIIAPSTGAAWRGQTISHWCLDPNVPRTRKLSWTDFRRDQGLPDGWTDQDRLGLDSPLQPQGNIPA